MKEEFKQGWWFHQVNLTDIKVVYEDYHQIIVASKIRPEQRSGELIRARPCLENEDLDWELTFFELRPNPQHGHTELTSVGSHFVSKKLLESLTAPYWKPTGVTPTEAT